MRAPEVSIVVASDRVGPDLDGCLSSLARQEDAPPFEVLVVSAEEPGRRGDLLVGWIRMEERNPAMRRNRGADFAAGRLLAFIDDDARAAPGWLRRASGTALRTPLFGGIDVLPEGSTWGERMADLLLATPGVGSAVPAHERAPRGGPVRLPSDLALCNMFVARDLFDRLGGFDESLGYIGEDTDFVHRAVKAGVAPELDPGLVVFHRRRAFPGAFLAQRWKYRVKSGRRLVERPDGAPTAKIAAFLAAGAAAAAGTALFGRRFAIPAAALYAAGVWAASASIWRRDPALFPAVPAAF
ncbi:MAG TPA: glycosyltransferase, partial [Thermoanaerobaculia bacterium]|nr:glycosyltransferase [Thermoanaerobaculia bacterium]